MPNRLYPAYKQACLTGDAPDLLSEDVHVVLVDADGYTFDAAHEFLSNVPLAARISTTAPLAGKVAASGTFDADNVSLPDTGGLTGEALVLFAATGADETSRLIAYIDTAVGLPLAQDSLDDMIRWAPSGIFTL
jgi:hypothetical protein